MKVVIFVLILAVIGAGVLYYTRSSIEEGFDPTEQGRQARAAINTGAPWTEILEVAGEPRKWKEGSSGFDFVLGYLPFDEATRDEIRQGLEKDELRQGFCFLYRFSDAATFAVNFSRRGVVLNIQNKESKADLME